MASVGNCAQKALQFDIWRNNRTYKNGPGNVPLEEYIPTYLKQNETIDFIEGRFFHVLKCPVDIIKEHEQSFTEDVAKPESLALFETF